MGAAQSRRRDDGGWAGAKRVGFSGRVDGAPPEHLVTPWGQGSHGDATLETIAEHITSRVNAFRNVARMSVAGGDLGALGEDDRGGPSPSAAAPVPGPGAPGAGSPGAPLAPGGGAGASSPHHRAGGGARFLGGGPAAGHPADGADDGDDATEITWATDADGRLYFNEYIVVRPLGRGAHGKVMLCRDRVR